MRLGGGPASVLLQLLMDGGLIYRLGKGKRLYLHLLFGQIVVVHWDHQLPFQPVAGENFQCGRAHRQRRGVQLPAVHKMVLPIIKGVIAAVVAGLDGKEAVGPHLKRRLFQIMPSIML